MRLATVDQNGESRLMALDDALGLIDVNRSYAALCQASGMSRASAQGLADAHVSADVVEFLSAGQSALAEANRAVEHVQGLDAGAAARNLLVVPAEGARLLCPVPRPPKIICVARNFGEHAREAGLQISEIPILFARFSATLVPDGDPVVVPSVSEQLDWEGEVAVVIGKPGRYISKKDAMSHVVGYSLFNDVTVRDYQFRVTQYTGGKNFHASGPFGPYLVLADEVDDPNNLEIVTTVNGIEKQRGSTSDFIFDIPTIIEHISEFIELEAGDVIPMGTPAGVGFKRDPPEFLRAGDSVAVTATGLGTLTNPVVGEQAAA